MFNPETSQFKPENSSPPPEQNPENFQKQLTELSRQAYKIDLELKSSQGADKRNLEKQLKTVQNRITELRTRAERAGVELK